MHLRTLALAAMLGAGAVALGGCMAVGAAGAVAGTAVGVTAKGVGMAAHGAGMVVRAATGSGKKDDQADR